MHGLSDSFPELLSTVTYSSIVVDIQVLLYAGDFSVVSDLAEKLGEAVTVMDAAFLCPSQHKRRPAC